MGLPLLAGALSTTADAQTLGTAQAHNQACPTPAHTLEPPSPLDAPGDEGEKEGRGCHPGEAA